VVARLNSNGQMSLLTRTERYAHLTVPLQCIDNSHFIRTILAIVSMPLQAGGRKIRTFTGIIATQMQHPMSARRRSVKLRKPRLRRSPLHCMIRSLSTLTSIPEYLLALTHTAVSGHPRRKHHRQVHKARAQMPSPSLPPH
jgi:hypothetical protein